MVKKISAENITKLDRLEVRGLLARQGATMRDLAQHLGVSFQHTSALVSGNRNPRRYVQRIADFLRVPPRTILVPLPMPRTEDPPSEHAHTLAAGARD